MARYTVYVQSGGIPITGLSLTWSMFKNIVGDDITPPTISEIGNGWYKFDFSGDIAQKYVGVINCGTAVDEKSRYIPIDFVENGDETEAEVFVTPLYQDGYGVTYLVGLSIEGNKTDSSELASCIVNVYDIAHTLVKSLNTTSSTNGIFVLTDVNTTYDNDGYYVIAEVTVTGSNKTYKSIETMVVLQ